MVAVGDVTSIASVAPAVFITRLVAPAHSWKHTAQIHR